MLISPELAIAVSDRLQPRSQDGFALAIAVMRRISFNSGFQTPKSNSENQHPR